MASGTIRNGFLAAHARASGSILQGTAPCGFPLVASGARALAQLTLQAAMAATSIAAITPGDPGPATCDSRSARQRRQVDFAYIYGKNVWAGLSLKTLR